jgi:predicted ArsR family transcriptional regulator
MQSVSRDTDDGEMPLGKLKAVVFDCLRDHGPQTDEEMQELLGMGSSTQRPRRVELWEAGLIEQCGTKPTKSGRTAALWREANRDRWEMFQR